MASSTLAVAGVLSAAVGVGFLFVARGVARRGATDDRVLARRAHTAWWACLGVYLVVQGALTMAASLDALDARAYLVSRVAVIPLLCAATWGLTFYLVYLYTGNTRHAMPLAALYVGVAALFFYVTYAQPQELVVQRWLLSLDDSGPLYRLLYALVGLPPILASGAYLALLRRVRDRAQRYRIALVAGSILLYVGSGLAARLLSDDRIVFVTLVLFGLAAAGASLAAYYPPAFVRRLLREGA